MSYWSIRVFTSLKNPGIDLKIAAIRLTPQTLLTPETKEIITDAASGGNWISRTLRQVSRTGIDRSTPGENGNDIGIIEPPSPVLIGIIGTAPPCDLNVRQEVGDKWQSTSPGLVRQSQELDTIVDGKLPDNINLMSIFRKVIIDKLSRGSSRYLYKRCRTNFAADPVQIQTPQLVDLGISTINALDEVSGISTPATRTQRPTDGAHWSVTNHIFGETAEVGVSEAKSVYDYNYKNEF